ncbi:glycosyl transferase [Vibrio anguillarum]|nr:glycosyl transferase [Vibrio anguillarum]
MKKSIIFHHPLPLNFEAPSGSGIRPVQMYKAFISLGYDVELVVGYSKERYSAIQKVKKKIKDGNRYDFCYSEASTMPLSLTDKDHIPRSPFMDAIFFSFLNKKKVKIGVFYRDVYWQFEELSSLSLNQRLKKLITHFFYRAELVIYNLFIDSMFVPSLNMKKYIPYIQQSKFFELNPGSISVVSKTKQVGDKLEIFYVGGMVGYYNINLFIRVVGECFNESINFTICTREADAKALREIIRNLPSNVQVVSRSGKELEALYENVDCACLYMEPTEYRDFAVPVKLFEYVSYGKPVIATASTWVGEFVNEQGLGWKVDYSEHSLKEFLQQLLDEKYSIPAFAETVRERAYLYSWEKRCREVEVALGSVKQ